MVKEKARLTRWIVGTAPYDVAALVAKRWLSNSGAFHCMTQLPSVSLPRGTTCRAGTALSIFIGWQPDKSKKEESTALLVRNVSRSERGRQSAGQIPGPGGEESTKWPKEQEKGTCAAWRAACWIESQPSETSCCEGEKKM